MRDSSIGLCLGPHVQLLHLISFVNWLALKVNKSIWVQMKTCIVFFHVVVSVIELGCLQRRGEHNTSTVYIVWLLFIFCFYYQASSTNIIYLLDQEKQSDLKASQYDLWKFSIEDIGIAQVFMKE